MRSPHYISAGSALKVDKVTLSLVPEVWRLGTHRAMGPLGSPHCGEPRWRSAAPWGVSRLLQYGLRCGGRRVSWSGLSTVEV